MEVKVNLELHAPGHCQDHKDLSQWFKCLCKAVSIEPLEPLCPFCGDRLQDARCQCHEFDVKLQKFLSSYKDDSHVGEDLHIGLKPEIPCATVFKTADMSSQIHVTTFSGNLLSLFDYGTAACNRKQTWFVSQGSLEGPTLSFWIRQKGCETVYRCYFSGIPEHLIFMPQVRVYILKSEFMGNNPKSQHSLIFTGRKLRGLIGGDKKINTEQEVDVMSYAEFLEKLKEL